MLLDRVLGQCSAGPAAQARGRRPWCVCLGRTVVFAVLACLGGLTALVHASPPDPIWLPGIYDGADYDDEIAFLTDAAAVRDPAALAGEPLRPVLRLTLFGAGSARADASLLGFHLRSPPIA
jgi:hypothetical protein